MKPFLILLLMFSVTTLKAQIYSLDLSREPQPVQRGHLELGGSAPGGGTIAVNSYYLEQNGRPFVPIVGEFHFCRYPAEYWEESLRKLKAGGINVVATYVFWNIHERVEGHFDWTGNLNLRHFIELAQKVGLQAIVRIGPFGHGEIRNGGLPDWLYGRALEIRSNDPAYLAQVDKLYDGIAGQLTGLLYKDGGPVIGIQLENEFQHSAAPWEISHRGAPTEFTVAARDADVTHTGVSVSEVENRNAGYGRDHLVNLKAIARRHGLDVPIYTATGWGNAAIVPRGSIPVTAAYPYPFWAAVSPSPFYLFKDIHLHPDYRPVSYEPALYPSLAAELGAGISPLYSRRPFVPEASIEPLIVRVLGSGSNGIGYYMYHGGATPVFDHFYNEDTSGLAKINYDYQAPIGQYGQIRSHFHSLKLLHLFLQSYGERLAPLPSILPPTNESISSLDTGTLRYAARASGGSGFIFLINFQDHVVMHDLPHLQLRLGDGRREISVPSTGEFILKAGASVILPVNLDLNGINLRSATVQPLAIVHPDGAAHFVFFSIAGLPAEMVFDDGHVTALKNCRLAAGEGRAVTVSGPPAECFSFQIDGRPVLVLTRELALKASKTRKGGLWFTDATIISDDHGEILLSRGESAVDVNVYPAVTGSFKVAGATLTAATPLTPGMSAFRITFTPVSLPATTRQITEHKYAVRVPSGLRGLNDVFMRIDYTGDTGMAFIDGQMVDDDYYFGRPWEIGLKRFTDRLRDSEFVFVFQPMRKDATYLSDIPEDRRPVFTGGQESLLSFRGVELIPEYKAVLTFP
jgi:beta-galactosidase